MSIKCLCCNKSKEDVPKMIQINEELFICNICTSEVNGLFAKGKDEVEKLPEKPKLLPSEIKNQLDDYVIGQNNAKKVLAVELYNHYKRINNPDFNIQKSNILLVGNSGTGKTLIMQKLATIIDVPITIVDCTGLTENGYIGNDIESILQSLVSAADGDIKKAQTGIVFLDECCKLAKRDISSTQKDVSGEGVQQGLLKIIEGTNIKIKVEGSRRSNSSEQYIDTTNILFVAGGAFFGLEKILETNHTKENSSIGFSASVEKSDYIQKEITQEDIIHYGFIPEFVGRLPVIVKLEDLTKEDYKRILTEPKNNIIEQYKNLMNIDEIKLDFTEDYLDGVVNKVFDSKRGARALRTEIEKTMRDIVFNINEQSFNTTITI